MWLWTFDCIKNTLQIFFSVLNRASILDFSDLSKKFKIWPCFGVDIWKNKDFEHCLSPQRLAFQKKVLEVKWHFPSIGILTFLKLLILLFLFCKMIQCERLGKKAIPVFLSFTVHLPMPLKLQKICYLLSQFVFVSSFHHPFYTKWVQSISEVSIESKYNNIIYIVE